MNDQKFDRMLMEMAGSLPPGGEKATAEDFTPWHTAMSRILWGMGLMTFRLEIFYLQYLLPLVGAVGGAVNLTMYRRVSSYGARKYRKRFLERRAREAGRT